ncbi:hypothetical protein [Pseudomonas syringae group genomosp. 3]|uniref:Uncharacterized protein n=1 Tax=Pseudomonas syringae pv. coriandricola TaxID=264453 RepID=A0A3M3JRA7_9PSED|nr:hypothetical protein [Pseudomonas syringae group genomosp. 3]RMN13432.1 hypothetical protein ALQ65_03656 [Pseudomonas syringae pv. coriandricola]
MKSPKTKLHHLIDYLFYGTIVAAPILLSTLLYISPTENLESLTAKPEELTILIYKDKLHNLFGKETIGLYNLSIIDSWDSDFEYRKEMQECITTKRSGPMVIRSKFTFDNVCFEINRFRRSGEPELNSSTKDTLYSEFKDELNRSVTRNNVDTFLKKVVEVNSPDYKKPEVELVRSNHWIYAAGVDDARYSVNRKTNWSNDFGYTEFMHTLESSYFVVLKHLPCTRFEDEFSPSKDAEATDCKETAEIITNYLYDRYYREIMRASR